jgi:hypothetical protein
MKRYEIPPRVSFAQTALPMRDCLQKNTERDSVMATSRMRRMGFEPTTWHSLKQENQRCNDHSNSCRVPLKFYEGRNDVLHIQLSAINGHLMRP